MFGFDKTVLVLADEVVTVFAARRGAYELVAEISWQNPDITNELSKALREHSLSRPVVILYDMVEQYYRREMIQKNVGFLDQADLIRRRMNAAFPNYRMRAFWRMKPSKSVGRSGSTEADRSNEFTPYIFAALPDHANITSVSTAIINSGVVVAGLVLLPVESVSFVQKLADLLRPRDETKDRWVVLLTQHYGGGLRQIVIRNGEMALTRLSPVVDTDVEPGIWAAEVAQEFRATMGYLTRFGFNDDSELDVIAVGSPQAVSLLPDQITADRFYPMSVKEVAKLLKLRVRAEDTLRYGDVLHAAWVAGKTKFVLPFKYEPIAKVAGIRQLARAGMYGLALLAFANAGYLGYQIYQMINLADEVQHQEKVLLDTEDEYNKELKRKNEFNIDYKLVQASLDIVRKLDTKNIDLIKELQKISTAFDGSLKLTDVDMGYVTEQVDNPDPLSVQTLESKRFQFRFTLDLPEGMKPEVGNKMVSDFRDRLVSIFKDYDVSIEKAVRDLTFRTEATFAVETGKLKDSSGTSSTSAIISMKQKATGQQGQP